MSKTINPGYRAAYNVQPDTTAMNSLDEKDNPTGGEVNGNGLSIKWQDGPRGKEGTEELEAPNGAFVEDVLWAALQRLEFFQESKFKDRANAMAITHIEGALQALKDRQLERSHRRVEGKHEV